MSTKVVRFNKKNRPDFYKVLKTRINQYFKDNNISKHADLSMKVKTVFMISVYLVPLGLMLGGLITNTFAMLGLWVVMGLGMAGIGLSIMHDAIHGSYSTNKTVNFVLGYLIHIIGGCKINWKIQHNVLHHSFTNIDEYDEDIDIEIMRFTPDREWRWYHKYQAFYAPLLYGIMTMHWAVAKDFLQLRRYHKEGLIEKHGYNYKSLMAELVFNKLAYFAVFLALPLIFLPFPAWQIILGFGMMHYVCGLSLALIFQSAHVLEETEFFKVDQDLKVENNWAIHQLKTTANFSQENRLFSWLVGGLNYQVEHHLFPSICHTHYRALAPIIKKTAEEYGVPYNSHHTFSGALKSHFRLLNDLGTKRYDEKLEQKKKAEAEAAKILHAEPTPV